MSKLVLKVPMAESCKMYWELLALAVLGDAVTELTVKLTCPLVRLNRAMIRKMRKAYLGCGCISSIINMSNEC